MMRVATRSAVQLSTGVLLAALAVPAMAQTTWHVRAGAPPGGDGLSWAGAFASLDDGFAATQKGDSVWVAAGTYRPTQVLASGDPRTAVFDLPDLVDVYGGFRGHETSLAQRQGLFWETVLSGDIGVPGDDSDNAYHVVRFASDGNYHASARLDGFRITGGRGQAVQRGGGVRLTAFFGANSWAILDLANCFVTDNAAGMGGGLSVDNFCRMRILRTTVEGNHALTDGGGLHSNSGWVWAYNSVFRANTAGEDGGAVYTHNNAADSMRFVNSILHDNQARRGGAAYLGTATFFHGVAKFVQCTVAFNRADSGGAVFATGESVLKVRNSILWANQAAQGLQVFPGVASADHLVEYSDVQGGFTGAGNLDVDPRFVDALARDLRTLPGSPVHDVANQGLLGQDALDLDGDGDTSEPIPHDLVDTRRRDDDPLAPDGPAAGSPPPDMGAYEYHPGG